jgi:hypothetical protein
MLFSRKKLHLLKVVAKYRKILATEQYKTNLNGKVVSFWVVFAKHNITLFVGAYFAWGWNHGSWSKGSFFNLTLLVLIGLVALYFQNITSKDSSSR